MKDAQLPRHVRILSTDVVQMKFLQLKDLKIRDVPNHNVVKHYSDVVLINTHLQKEKTMKVVQFQPHFLQPPRKLLTKPLFQLTIDSEMIKLINLPLKNHAPLMNLDVVQMVRKQLRDPTSKDVMAWLMKKIVTTRFMDVVMMARHQLLPLTRKIAHYAPRNHLDVAQMVILPLMDITVKDVAQYMNSDVVPTMLPLLAVPEMKVAIVTTRHTVVAKTKKLQQLVMTMLDVVANKLNLDVALISLPQLKEISLKDAHVTLCNLDVAQMASQFHKALIIMDVTVPKHHTSVALMIKHQLKDLTLKDVLVLKANSDVVKMVSRTLKGTNSKVALLSKKSHKKLVHYMLIQEIKSPRSAVKITIPSNISSTTLTDTATGSGIMVVEKSVINSIPKMNVNKPALNTLERKLAYYLRAPDLVRAVTRDSTSMPITTDAKNLFMVDVTEIPTISRLFKNVKACALPTSLHVSI